MLSFALQVAIGCIGLALLMNVFRLLHGPHITDRILALDVMFINTIALVVLLGIQLQMRLFFEIAVLIALMGFLGTIAMTKFLVRGDIIE